MSYLIIPDIHNRVDQAEALASSYSHRKVVFLGDYFDSFHDSPTEARYTAEWLRYSANQPNRIHLMGNHDLPYRWHSQTCPGYSPDKNRAVAKVMRRSDWERVRLAHIIHKEGLRPLALAHAGFTLCNLYGLNSNADVAPANRHHPAGRMAHLRDLSPEEHLLQIRAMCACAATAAEMHGDHHFLNQGDRMGELNIGGPFWIDRSSVRHPLPGIDQIVGHSIVDRPKRLSNPNAKDAKHDMWFIDGAGKYAALVDMEDNGRGGLTVTPIWAAAGRMGEPIII